MAVKRSVSTSMSAKLMQKMNPYGYKKFCAVISERDSISLDFYKASKWVNYFVLDTSLMFKNGKVDPDHVYKLFGSFNGLSAHKVRMHLLEYIYDNMDFFEGRSTVYLAMHGIGINTWVQMVGDNRICCDKLALLGLSAMYQRHSLVVAKNKFWSTIETKEPLSIIALMKECTVRLLYLGNMKFGTRRWQPRNPQPAQKKLNPGQFKIIEEYTLDKPTTSGDSSVADNGETERVETKTLPETAPPIVIAMQQKQELSSVHVETSIDNTALKVETLSSADPTINTADAFPLLKDLKVVVPKLKEADIHEWSDKVRAPNMDLLPVET